MVKNIKINKYFRFRLIGKNRQYIFGRKSFTINM